ncbi:MAG: RNA methyltransferase [Bacteroidaceae bacterium]|nr:RNA methyltransferase [Bacteroidaceae bacterium]
MLLSSVHNPRIRQLQLLQQKSSERRRTGLFVVEGVRELGHCLTAGYRVQTLLTCPSLLEKHREAGERLATVSAREHYEITPAVYERLAYRDNTEGVIAVVETRTTTLQQLQLPDNPLIVVVERVEKPGNLGAILRSAEAAHADAVVVCDALTDIYNPNIIRSSLGAVFLVPTVVCTTEACIGFLTAQGVQILTAQLQDSQPYYATDMRRATAIVMGAEDTGLSDVWRKAADSHIRIPMLGQLDSLNVSVSTAILLFEAVRQREQERKQKR